MPVFSKMFNKYWDKDIKVDVVSHKKIKLEEKNFTCFQYEEDNFSKCMLEHMSKLDFDHVVFMTEEMVLVDFVDQDIFKKAYKIIKYSDKIKKINLYRFLNNYYKIGIDDSYYGPHLSYYDDDFAFNKDSFRSINASIWNKDLFCELLQSLIDAEYDKITPHTFEYNVNCTNDFDSLIPYKPVYPCIDYMHRTRGFAFEEARFFNNGISSQDLLTFVENKNDNK
jgi:hypothetical protein